MKSDLIIVFEKWHDKNKGNVKKSGTPTVGRRSHLGVFLVHKNTQESELNYKHLLIRDSGEKM